MLARGDFDIMFLYGLTDLRVPKDIVRRSWLFDEEGFEGREVREVGFCLGDGPDLWGGRDVLDGWGLAWG